MYCLFIVPPFQEPSNPAIGVSNLLTLVRKMGIKSKIIYENISLLQDLSLPVYNFITGNSASMTLLIGDFMYALLRMPQQDREDALNRYLKEIVAENSLNHPRVINAYKDFILKTIPVIEKAGQNTVSRVIAEDPDIIGLTIGAYQLNAGLYLAQKIKEAAPAKQVWFGGSYCSGQVGYHLARFFPFIDVMFTGEAEKSLEAALKKFAHDRSIKETNGVVTRAMFDQGIEYSGEMFRPQLVEDLDELPIPDYADYFNAINRADEAKRIKPYILMESSRGCWWAEKGPCNFCGLNMQTKEFRTKSAGRVAAELAHQINTYGISRIVMVDNVLNHQFFKELFPLLKTDCNNLQIFYEARCSLSKGEIGVLRDAGVQVIQAGVEALDDELLQLLHKGTHSWQNLQVIKWCEELNLHIKYNLLYAIPGESITAYSRVLALLQNLHHLRPPTPTRIHLDGNSIYDLEGQRFGIHRTGVNPPSFAHCFPEQHIDPMLISHNFTNSLEKLDSSLPIQWAGLLDEILAWHDDYYNQNKRLFFHIDEGLVRIGDNRFSEEMQHYELDQAASQILLYCEAARTKESIRAHLHDLSDAEINKAIEELGERKFIFQLEERYISLVVKDNPETGFRRRLKRNFKDECYPVFQDVPETSQDFSWLFKNSANFFGFKYRHKHIFDNP